MPTRVIGIFTSSRRHLHVNILHPCRNFRPTFPQSRSHVVHPKRPTTMFRIPPSKPTSASKPSLNPLTGGHPNNPREVPGLAPRTEPARWPREMEQTTPWPYLGWTLAELEKMAIAATLQSHHGNKAKTARALGISLRSIYNKMRRHGLVVHKELRDRQRPTDGSPHHD